MKKLVLLIVGSFLLTMVSHARVKRVCNAPEVNAEYSSLENALMDCAAGDTIYLEASGTEYGPGDAYGFDPIRITKPITLIGPGYLYKENKVVNYTTGESFIASPLRIYSNNVTLSGLLLNNVEIFGNECTIAKCQILAGSQTAIEVADTVNGCIIRQNFIVGNVQGNGFPQNVNISNNIICGVVSSMERARIERNTFGKFNRFGGVYNLRFCTLIENVMNYDLKKSRTNTCSFLNNFNGDFRPEMTNPDFSLDCNYKIKETSKLYDMASDGDQLGAYGGAMPYVTSGLQDTPVIESYVAANEANQSVGLEVTIKYKMEK